MKRLLLAAMMAALASQAAIAQSSGVLPLTRTCTIASAAEAGQPRLILVDAKSADRSTTYLQVAGPIQLSGQLENVTISVQPFGTVLTTSGFASAGNASFLRANVTEGWAKLLDAIRKGESLTIASGDQSISMPLAGSGLAVAALQRCTK